ncbi:NADP-dependent phosphogluconate dehydrogenase [Buchnera aphidicola (Neophyllaphis podocarpi)]|uniref:NADP-dependent phosphogluconate dehydrogenase n=1 Tax=Buchnera aphidicola TaxID=9 RepID=UPI0031B82B52
MSKKNIGIIGMAVMGSNLAINIANNKYSVSIFNRSSEKTKKVITDNKDKNITAYYDIKKFILSLEKPRKILLMVKSGKAVDKTINEIVPYLNKGDIIIDGGNSFYKDTMIRNNNLSNVGLNFIGSGISGGEYGALIGPSIMPGGKKTAYDYIHPIFEKIAAKFNGESCVTYIGPNGSGHYVKMIHNGIEYGDMQLIAETYFLLKHFVGMSNPELSEIFCEWNNGELNSYLIEITKNIFIKKDKNDNFLIDMILDQADNKGTGKWTSKNALDLSQPLSLITESVFSRYISFIKSQRILASKMLKGPKKVCIIKNKLDYIEHLRRSLYLSKIICYAQGFSQLKAASSKYNWKLNFSNIAKIFRSGCIIKAKFLQKISDAYIDDNSLINLLLSSYFKDIANNYQNSLRYVVSHAINYGAPIPAFSAAISYYDSYRCSNLSSNLIQAQRDYFGAHTYKRIDTDGIFHTNWLN